MHECASIAGSWTSTVLQTYDFTQSKATGVSGTLVVGIGRLATLRQFTAGVCLVWNDPSPAELTPPGYVSSSANGVSGTRSPASWHERTRHRQPQKWLQLVHQFAFLNLGIPTVLVHRHDQSSIRVEANRDDRFSQTTLSGIRLMISAGNIATEKVDGKLAHRVPFSLNVSPRSENSRYERSCCAQVVR